MSLKVKSMLITGTNRGIGLEFVKQIVKLPHPPKWLFATCRNPDQAKVYAPNCSNSEIGLHHCL